MKTGTYWLGNDETPFFLYLTKDFDGRDKYGNFSNVKQLKRLSVDYDNGEIGVYQIKNRHFPITYFKYPDQNGYRRPIRHTVKGHRNHFFSFFLSGTDVEIVDMKLLDNVK